ncbi:MAG: S41 family peptidase [Tepidisphaeraceae bacterium]
MLLAILLLLTGCVTSRLDLRDEAPLTRQDRELSRASLDRIDALARQHQFSNAGWSQALRDARGAVDRCGTRGEMRQAIARLLQSTDRSHVAVIAGSATQPGVDDATPDFRVDHTNRVLVLTVGRLISPETLNPLIEHELTSAKPSGVVIDLRGNTGGVLALAAGVAGFFVDLDTPLGEVRQGGSSIPLVAHPRAVRSNAKLAVVIDAHTASAAEILAAGLQASGRAHIFGATNSAGAALPAVIEQLPNGDCFEYPVGVFVTSVGVSLEGRGVTPDVISTDPLADATAWAAQH